MDRQQTGCNAPSRNPYRATALSHAKNSAAVDALRLVLAFALRLAVSSAFAVRAAGEIGQDRGDPAGDECVECHWTENPGLTQEWNNSQHGRTGVNCLDCHKGDEMNLESDKCVAGVDYSAAPTCATCHMSRGGDQPKTHNVGERIAWTLRPPISQKINLIKLENGDELDVKEGRPLTKVGDAAKGSKVVEVLTWMDRRETMMEVCAACHSEGVIEGHYKQFDGVVDVYNERSAKPIAAVMGEPKRGGYITPRPFDDKIAWTRWEIRHHDRRRARHGASMIGPDYT